MGRVVVDQLRGSCRESGHDGRSPFLPEQVRGLVIVLSGLGPRERSAPKEAATFTGHVERLQRPAPRRTSKSSCRERLAIGS